MSSEQYLPWPGSKTRIKEYLQGINNSFLIYKEKTVQSRVKEPIKQMIGKTVFPIGSKQADWLDIYSIYNANQQLNEACNKLWAGIEITNIISPEIWKIKYAPVGMKFDGTFISGTIIPTIYYSQLSAIMANLSIFGVIPIMFEHRRYFMLRTQNGWRITPRSQYAQHELKIDERGQHEIIFKTFENLRDKNKIELPEIDLVKTSRLRKLRNEMQYEILGDLKMWRPHERKDVSNDMISLVIHSISITIDTIKFIKRLTTRCDERFENLVQNFTSYRS